MPKFIHVYKYVTERPVIIQDCDLWINADCIEQMQKDGDKLIVFVKGGCETKYIVDNDYVKTYDEVIDKVFPEPEYHGHTDF